MYKYYIIYKFVIARARKEKQDIEHRTVKLNQNKVHTELKMK